jgi:predicted ester cyclase
MKPVDQEALSHRKHSLDTLAAVKRMEAALARGETDMSAYFTQDFLWRGNRGAGTKRGIAEFRRNWQRPLRAAFSERVYRTEQMIADGDWAACFGHIEANHTGAFMGIAPTGRRIKIPYMDFWRVDAGRIADNPVFVDLAEVLFQLGRDVFGGEGWESFDEGRREPPAPEGT